MTASSPPLPLPPRIVLSPLLFVAGAQALAGSCALDGSAMVSMRSGIAGKAEGASWHAAFIHQVGYWTHFDARTASSRWPLPATNDCQVLAQFAASAGILINGEPRPGDIALLWSTQEQRFVHSAIVVQTQTVWVSEEDDVAHFDCTTIDGNIHHSGLLGGDGIHITRRSLSPALGDRFVRWVDLDGRATKHEPFTRDERCRAKMLRHRAA